MTKYFVEHPIPAVVFSLLLVLAGILAILRLPTAEYPNIAPPTVGVSTYYTGADVSVVNDTVGEVIEEAIAGIDGFDYMASTIDPSGNYNLSIVFKFGVDEDDAAIQVQNKIQSVQGDLPQVVRQNGFSVDKGNSEIALLAVLHSPNQSYDEFFLKNYADTHFTDKIRRTTGVGKVDFFSGQYAMRVWLNPDKTAENYVTINDVTNAITEQTARPAIGSAGKMPTFDIQEKEIQGRSKNFKTTPEEFENIVVRTDGTSLLRLKDIGRVEEGAKNFDVKTLYAGKNAAEFMITLNGKANALETLSEVKQILEDSKKDFPPDMDYALIVDSTVFINASLDEILETFVEALLLVVIIVLVFLQNPRATIISLLAIPVSLIATFIFFPPLGFTINTITLFALILAIGLVVDDAIVVIEIVERNLESGAEIKEATIDAMREVQKPIIAIACVLASVFLPVAMMEGITGELYKQFALTIVISMALSSFVALSLTPALCVLLLKKRKKKESKFNELFTRFENFYERALKIFMKKKILVFGSMILLTVGAVGLFRILPSEYVPDEDKGSVFVAVNLPTGTSLNRTVETMKKISAEINKIDEVKNSAMEVGRDIMADYTNAGNAGVFFTVLKDWDERDKDIFEIIEEIQNAATKVAPEANVFAMTTSSLPGLDSVGGLSMRLLNVRNVSDEELANFAEKISVAIAEREEIDDGEIVFSMSMPYMNFHVDEDKAKLSGVNLSDVYTALRVNFGGDEVTDFTAFGRNHKIVLQADKRYRSEFESVHLMFVKNSKDEPVPLDTLIKLENDSGIAVISRFNGLRCLNFEGNVAQGYSTGEAMAALEEIVEEIAPGVFQIEWTGISRQAKLAQDVTVEILILSLVFVFLCLVALYESWTLPFAVLLSVPAGIFGAMFGELLTGNLNSVYTQIGILVIIGLAAKNAILIVEFAKERIERGEKTFDAAVNAAKIRLRPILMTSLAFIAACIPLAMANGAGAGARNGMGAAVVGGMFFATMFGIFIVPLLFKVIVDRRFKD